MEVAPNSRPPVVKLLDYGKYRYDEQKKAREAKKKQHQTQLKEVQLRPRTDDHDFETKLRRARKFLKQGNMVKLVMRFRGREMRRPEVGIETLDRMIAATDDLSQLEHRTRNVEGRRLVALLEPALGSGPAG